jgi:hypothetical protein
MQVQTNKVVLREFVLFRPYFYSFLLSDMLVSAT